MAAAVPLRCPQHQLPLTRNLSLRPEVLECPRHCSFRVLGGIPRLVPAGHYAASFALQWKRFQRTQLDSFTGHPISAARLTRCLGGDLAAVRGKLVLEAGCGAGRFTEILLLSGATVVSCDLSEAVEANYGNHGDRPDLLVVQADILALPFVPESFDFVVCLGVIQHTPCPEGTIGALARFVRPGGELILDHYSDRHYFPRVNRLFRSLLLGMPAAWRLPVSSAVVHGLWPVHRLAARFPVLSFLTGLSPVYDYTTALPFLSPRQLKEFALLDTHDAHTDRFKHRRSPEQIEGCLRSLGLEAITVSRGGNGVEARARKPAV